MKWFRVHHRLFSENIRFKRLTAAEKGIYFHLYYLASRSDKRGTILEDDDDVAFELDMPLEDWQTLKAKLRVKGFIEVTGQGLKIESWNDDQFESDSSTERVRRYREKQRNAAETLHVTDETFQKRRATLHETNETKKMFHETNETSGGQKASESGADPSEKTENRKPQNACGERDLGSDGVNVPETFQKRRVTPSDTDTDTDTEKEERSFLGEKDQAVAAPPSLPGGDSEGAKADVGGKAKKKKAKKKSVNSDSNADRINTLEQVRGFFSGVRGGSRADKALGHVKRLNEFAGFCGWYREQICKPQAANFGNLSEAAEAWLELEQSNFLGQGYEEFRRGCLEFKKIYQASQHFGVRHACRFLEGGNSSAQWLDALESLGVKAEPATEFLSGVDVSNDLESLRKQIGIEQYRCGRNSLLPSHLAEKFDKAITAQLTAPEARIYLNWLKEQPSQEEVYAS